MKKEIYCKYCGEQIRFLHNNEKALYIVQHYRAKHPKEFREMVMAKEALDQLKEKFGYSFTFCDGFLRRSRKEIEEDG